MCSSRLDESLHHEREFTFLIYPAGIPWKWQWTLCNRIREREGWESKFRNPFPQPSIDCTVVVWQTGQTSNLCSCSDHHAVFVKSALFLVQCRVCSALSFEIHIMRCGNSHERYGNLIGKLNRNENEDKYALGTGMGIATREWQGLEPIPGAALRCDVKVRLRLVKLVTVC